MGFNSQVTMKFILALIILIIFSREAYTQTEGYVPSGGTQIYYRLFGTGKPLLIINGGPGMNSDGFVDLAKSLSKNNTVIIYDQRGTGRSTLQRLDSTTITIQLMANDIENLRKYLKIKQWIILGHSFGGMLASYYACVYPGNVKALILSSSGGIDLGLLSYVNTRLTARLSEQEKDSLQYWDKKIDGGDTSYFARLHRGLALAPAYVYDRKNISTIAERLTQGNSAVNNLVWHDLREIKFDCSSRLARFNGPVLIIQGREDIIEEKTAITEHNVLKNSRLVFMEHCVHYGWLDRPDIYFPEIKKFLAAN